MPPRDPRATDKAELNAEQEQNFLDEPQQSTFNVVEGAGTIHASSSGDTVTSYVPLTDYDGQGPLPAGSLAPTMDVGSAGDDRYIGNDGDNMFTGGDGNDVAYMGAGDDYVNMGAGHNEVYFDGADGDMLLIDTNLFLRGQEGETSNTVYGFNDDATIALWGPEGTFDDPSALSIEVIMQDGVPTTNIIFQGQIVASLVGYEGSPDLSFTDNGFAVLGFNPLPEENTAATPVPEQDGPVEDVLPEMVDNNDPPEGPHVPHPDPRTEVAGTFGEVVEEVLEDTAPSTPDPMPEDASASMPVPEQDGPVEDVLPDLVDNNDPPEGPHVPHPNPHAEVSGTYGEVAEDVLEDTAPSTPDSLPETSEMPVSEQAVSDLMDPVKGPMEAPHTLPEPNPATEIGHIDHDTPISTEDLSQSSSSTGVSVAAPEPVPLIAVVNPDGTTTVTHGFLPDDGDKPTLETSDLLEDENSHVDLSDSKIADMPHGAEMSTIRDVSHHEAPLSDTHVDDTTHHDPGATF